MSTIITLTLNPSVDVFLAVSEVVADRKLRSARPIYEPAGGGIRVSRAIRHLNGTSLALFTSGGTTGITLAELLRRQSIDSVGISIAEETRQNVNVTATASGKEYRFLVPGPSLGIDEWQHALRVIGAVSPRPKYVVASGSLPSGAPADFYARVARLATKNDFRLIVDTTGEPLRHALGAGTYLIKPNVRELEYISGERVIGIDHAETVARTLIARSSVEVIVVSLGTEGALVVERGGVTRINAPDVPVVSRIGAGASMVGGMTLALSRGWNLVESVRYGVAAGSAATMMQGHQLCRYEDTERLYQEVGARVAVV